jgi:uncharacterized protein involved in type VI secretion and phage assembly
MNEISNALNRKTEREAGPPSISVGTVSSNVDISGLGRVQVRVAWLPGTTLWARVALPMAGDKNGTYFIPQPGDEVIVAFNQSDISEVYVIGCLWSSARRPSKDGPSDPKTKRSIRTPQGQELLFDDQSNLIEITTAEKQRITLARDHIELSAGNGKATLSLGADGAVKLKGSVSVSIEAPNLTVNGSTRLELKSNTAASLNGGASCEVKAGLVKIN